MRKIGNAERRIASASLKELFFFRTTELFERNTILRSLDGQGAETRATTADPVYLSIKHHSFRKRNFTVPATAAARVVVGAP